MQFPFFSIAYRSLMNRRFSVALTMISLALSVMLFAGVDKIREGAREGFETTISGTDLIVGAPSGQINLLLFTVFRIGEGAGGISHEAYEHFASRPEVAWTIPMALGDSYRSYRVLGTDNNYFEHYQYGNGHALDFEAGGPFAKPSDVVLGASVARALDHQLGDSIHISHGLVATRFSEHDEQFVVTGILQPTGTPVDDTVHVSLAGLDLVHAGMEGGYEPGQRLGHDDGEHAEDAAHDHEDHAHEDGHDHEADHEEADHEHDEADHEHDEAGHDEAEHGEEGHDGHHEAGEHHHDHGEINAFLVGLKSRPLALRLQREINDYEAEPLMAILPGYTLSRLWASMNVAETALLGISAFVIAIGLIGMLVRVMASLNERRREMAIFRALGARPRHIFGLLILETGLTALVSAIAGLALLYGAFFVVGQFFETSVSIPALSAILSQRPGLFDVVLVLAVVVSASILSIVPAWMAYRGTLADGLTVRQ